MKKALFFLLILGQVFLSALSGYAQDAMVNKIAGDGAYPFVEGSTEATTSFIGIGGACSDSSGNVYIYDQGLGSIRKIDAVTHLVTTIAGNGTGGFSGDGGPAVLAQLGSIIWWYPGTNKICADNAGNVYFSDAPNHRIRKINTTTEVITTIAGGGTTYYFTDTVAATSVYLNNDKIMLDRDGNLVFLNTTFGEGVQKMDLSTGMIYTIAATPADSTWFNDFTMDSHGNYYFLVTHNNTVYDEYGEVSYYVQNPTIQKRNATGVYSIIAGSPLSSGFSGDGSSAASSLLRSPSGILADSAGNIYFEESLYNPTFTSSSLRNTIRKIDAITGNINTVCGANQLSYLPYGSLAYPAYADSFHMNVVNPRYISPAGKVVFTTYSTLMELDQSSLALNSTVYFDNTLDAAGPCVATEKSYGLYGSVLGTPASGDSIHCAYQFGANSVAYYEAYPSAVFNFTLPFYSTSGPSGETIYKFGDSISTVFSHQYRIPGIYNTGLHYTIGHGIGGEAFYTDTVRTSCNAALDNIILTSFKDSIITYPCSGATTVRYSVRGITFSNDGSMVTANDSVYLLIEYGDGDLDTVVVNYDGALSADAAYFSGVAGSFHYTVYHTFAAPDPGLGAQEYTPHISAILNSGISSSDLGYDYYYGGTGDVIFVDDCSLRGIAAWVYPQYSATPICVIPHTSNVFLNPMFFGSADTLSSVTCDLNFGDGTDTSLTLPVITDGHGLFNSYIVIPHTYYMSGDYTPSVTMSPSADTVYHTTLSIGSSCSPLSGTFYKDDNGNCAPDTGETRLGHWPMALINTTRHDTSYAWCDGAGHYSLTLIDGDAYTLIPNYFGAFGYGGDSLTLSCPSVGSYAVTADSGVSYTQNFGFICSGSPADMDMSVSGWGWGFVPGDTAVIGIWSSNAWGYMCDSLSTTLTLTMDPLLTYLGMWDGPAPTSISGHTLSWTFGTEAALFDFHADVKAFVDTTATMGAIVHNMLYVAPTTVPDDDTTNNRYSWSEPVRSSWDPNEKQVSPQGYGPQGYIPNGTALSYVIHFQNTGTAPAHNITVNDTISANLDIATLQVISSSSPVLVYQPELLGNVIKFRFNDINLPDSTDDPSGSIGYISYSIAPKANLAPGTQIINDAGIYFDYNPAVVTNSTINTIEDTLHEITGLTSVCPGASITLSNSLTGGVWAASNANATVVNGIVTGVAIGLDTISYTMYGNQVVTKVISVGSSLTDSLPDPGVLSGASVICAGGSTTLTPTVSGGVWSSGPSATVVDGVVTGVMAGTATVLYSVTNTCGTVSAPMVITIDPLSAPGSISGADMVCVGSATTLTPTVSGGAWSSSPSVTVTDGVVSGITTGAATVSYAVTNSCGTTMVQKTITVSDVPDPGALSGATTVCVGATTTLTPTVAGGAWTSGAGASVSGGVVTGIAAGTAIISYSVANLCGTAIAPTTVTINPLPDAGTISGTITVCVGATTTLTPTVAGGAWTGDAAASVSGGVVTGVTAGSAVISYSVTNSCGTAIAPTTVTINPLPDAGTISGTTTVCVGATTTLTPTVAGGTWTGGADASVSGGVVTGVTAGSAVISYSVTNSCGTAIAPTTVTVNPLPDAGAISGAATLCVGATTTITPTVATGVWSSSAAGSIAGGVLTGVVAGTDTVSYTVTNTCGTATASTFITIDPLPDAGTISGTATVCVGGVTTLSSTITGGTWASGSSTATVAGGVVTGVTAGTDTITYAVTNSCGTASATEVVTVNPLPVAGSITGADTVCVGDTIVLANTATDGAWSSLATTVATVSSTGAVIGVTAGVVDIHYTATNSCGTQSATHTVTVLSLADCNLSVVNTNGGKEPFRIYPNPSNGTFTIEIPAPGNNATITIMDVYGKVIEQRSIDNAKGLMIPVVMSNVASGTYLIKVDADGVSYREKMIVW